jgi:esterase/lipase superfamily enzyme
MGKQVCANDTLHFPSVLTAATVANSATQLSAEDVDFLLSTKAKRSQDEFIQKTFEGIFYNMDPPYVPLADDNCYIKRYHFLEGLACYWEGKELMMSSKVRKIVKPFTLKRKMEIWSSRAKYCNYGEWIPQSRRFLFTQKVS